MGIHGVACCKQTKQPKNMMAGLELIACNKETRTKAYMGATQVKGVQEVAMPME